MELLAMEWATLQGDDFVAFKDCLGVKWFTATQTHSEPVACEVSLPIILA